jgi:uncharacterized protein YndB with AHSA1/START domain
MTSQRFFEPVTHALRVERRFQASPERVFQAWTTAAELGRWSSPDQTPAEVHVDLRVGGRYQMAMAAPDGVVHRVVGVYREIDAPRRIVYTWRWETIPDFPETVVTVDFRRRADGGTDLLLMHEGLPDTPSGRRHEIGWAASLDKLRALFE